MGRRRAGGGIGRAERQRAADEPILGTRCIGAEARHTYTWLMSLPASAVADAFVEFTRGSGTLLRGLLADDCVDHVSGRTGREVWDVVSGWLHDSFDDIEVDLHAIGMAEGGRVMIWMTTHATHVGSAFPWMRGRPASGRRVAWSQLHVFRAKGGRLVEHWAVRDDLRVLEAIDAP